MRVRAFIARTAVAVLVAAGLATVSGGTPAAASPSGMFMGTFVTNRDGRLEAFGVAPSSNSFAALWHNYQYNGAWSGWSLLGAPPGANISVRPVVGINPDSRLEAFTFDDLGNLYHMWQDDSPDNGWSGWALLRHFTDWTDLAVDNDASGRLVVMVTAESSLWQFTPVDNNWVATDLGSPDRFTNVVGEVALGRDPHDGRLDVFAVAGVEKSSQGVVYRRWQTSPNGPWSGWVLVPRCNFPNARGLTVTTNADGRLELFSTSPTTGEYKADLCHMWQDPNQSGGWSGWDNFGDGTLDSTLPVEAMTNGQNKIEVFAMRTGGTLVGRWQTAPNGGWNSDGFINHGSGFSRGFALGRNGDGRLELMAFRGGKPYHSWQLSAGGEWSGWVPLEAG